MQNEPPANQFGDRRRRRGGHHDDAVLVALALAHDDLAARRINVFHPQPAAFHEAEAGAVHQAGHQPIRLVRRQRVKAGQEQRHFLARQDGGKAPVAAARRASTEPSSRWRTSR